ncbi:DUF4386 domain-containing protein [Parvularcula dongshanensis]|uniref:DUF4386 domain-containing protein n=1 Tax=Parvularcula dongshanensis TaxID=1173995 RepID=A0A840I2J2_9PROT|nr:DUF4386 domain-containing protein [Parvularcula dongshanensis]MBB4659226.1 hypothetical protein [Parvularcula dongshanensis]
MESTEATNPKAYARLTGACYLGLGVAGIFGGFLAIAAQVVPGDPVATAQNLALNGGMVRAGILAWMLTLVLDVVVAWGLYVLTRPADTRLSVLMAWLRLVYVAVHAGAAANLARALRYAEGGGHLEAFGTDQLAALASDALLAHRTGFEIALLFFGLHLGLLAVLLWRSGFMPKLIAALLCASSAAYLVNAVAFLGLATYDRYAALLLGLVSVLAIVAELALAGYLLAVGIRTEPWLRADEKRRTA